MKKIISSIVVFTLLLGCITTIPTVSAKSKDQVTSFTLVNSKTNQDILQIRNGMTINLQSLPTNILNIRANTNPKKVGSVLFKLNGKAIRKENVVPYAFAGDRNGNYSTWKAKEGTYTLTAIPYSQKSAKGIKGQELTIKFKLVNNNTDNDSSNDGNIDSSNDSNNDSSNDSSNNNTNQELGEGVFLENGGKVVMEVESVDPAKGWKLEKTEKDYTGSGYFRWDGGNTYDDPGKGTLTYQFKINEPGTYEIAIRNHRGDHPEGDKENDCFVKLDNGNWLKTYSHNNAWVFSMKQEVGNNHQKAIYKLDEGVHSLQISGRSQNFMIDRIHIFKQGVKGLDDKNQSSSKIEGNNNNSTNNNTNTSFKGRIAVSADGNQHDKDDWAATPATLAILEKAGLTGKLVHYDYNSHIWGGAGWQEDMQKSALTPANIYGFDKSVFYDDREDLNGAVNNLVDEINASTANDPLYIICAGPIEVVYKAVGKANSSKRQYVTVISHSGWNDKHADKDHGGHSVNDVKKLGVKWDAIKDQNGGFNTNKNYSAWHWMKNSIDPGLKFVYQRMDDINKADISDCGMAYYLITGDENGNSSKLQNFFK